MRLGRIASPDGVSFVSIEGVRPDGTTAREIAEHPFGTPTFTGRSWPLADVRLLAPMLAGKVVCIGKNYADHIAEMSSFATGPAPADPVIFLKPNTAIIGPNVPIRLPANASPVHFEGELAAVIGRPCKDVSAAQAADNILGYTIGNDVSARDQQKADGQWTRAKGHDTFCPVGPWVVTDVDPGRPGTAHRSQRRGQAGQPHLADDPRHRRHRGMDLGGDDACCPAISSSPEHRQASVPSRTATPSRVTIEGIGTLTNPVVRKGKS